MKCSGCGKFRKSRDLREVHGAIGDIYEVCRNCRPDLFTIAASIKKSGWSKPE